tara:strand:- start:4 stop:642 length:639 start_codon:yes stop_codon:yes gene_type:complete
MNNYNIEEIYLSLIKTKSELHYLNSKGKSIPKKEIFFSGSESRVILSGSFNPIHSAHIQLVNIAAKIVKKPILFELSIKNQESSKGLLKMKELEKRILQFKNIGDLVITNLPTFEEKSFIFKNSVFVVGYDTANRILDKNYYSNKSDKSLIKILSSIYKNNCTFLVAGRLHLDQFKTLKDLKIPKGFESMFQEIDQKKFRSDQSSTKIRKSL